MDTELKPCPFCGEEAGICEANDICFHRDDDGNKIFGGWRCFCPSCAIEQVGYETREEAVSAWNNRSTEHATHRAPVDEKGGGRMTGIERLRKLIEDYRAGNECDGFECTELSCGKCMAKNVLEPIADQIERERACDGDTAENIRLIVGRVIDDMERHVLGHEGMEDSPVARWARELREALKSDTSDSADTQNPSWHDPADAAGVTSEAAKVTRDPAEDVSMSAYDLLPQEERDAIAWVRDHGGLDSVKKLLDWVVGHCSTRRQLDFDFWLSGRVMHELGFDEDVADRDEVERRLLARLMPDGYEWPRYESGEPVQIGDVVSDVEVRSVVFRDGGILLSDCTSVPGWGTWRSYKEPIKRPAPKVLAADGAECHVGDHGYWLDQPGIEVIIKRIDSREMSQLTVYDTHGRGNTIGADEFTHERPDSWERLEEDAMQLDIDLNDTTDDYPRMSCCRDLVRRAKELARKENNNE